MSYTFTSPEALAGDAQGLCAALREAGVPISQEICQSALAQWCTEQATASAQNHNPAWCNRFQRSALNAYDEGEHAYLLDCPSQEEFETHLVGCDDLLFGFVLSELATDQDCDTREVALQRLETAIRQLQSVWAAIEALDEPANEVVNSEGLPS